MAKKKTCVICGLPKPLKEFYDNPSSKDGKAVRCKECTLIHNSMYQKSKYIPGSKCYHKPKYTMQDSFLLNCY